MTHTTRAALVLQQVEERISRPMLGARERTALRCLETAIVGLIEAAEWIDAAHSYSLEMEHYPRAEKYREASECAMKKLTTLCDLWQNNL